MSKLKPLSVSDSFNVPSGQPPYPGSIDWTTVIIVTGVVLCGCLLTVYCVNHSTNKIVSRLDEAHKTTQAEVLSASGRKHDSVLDFYTLSSNLTDQLNSMTAESE